MYIFYRRILETLELIAINLYVTLWDAWEYLHVLFRYYGKRPFRRADLRVIWLYLLRSPFKISKRFLASRGEADIYAYGETPLTTLALTADACGLGPEDVVYELGCGRGRTCFWLRAFKGCQVVGVELIPIFIKVAQRIQKAVGMEGITFVNGDMVEQDFSKATCVYLYGTGFDREILEKLVGRLGQLPRGARVVTVSYPLSDYSLPDFFETEKILEGPFNWGTARIFIQKKL